MCSLGMQKGLPAMYKLPFTAAMQASERGLLSRADEALQVSVVMLYTSMVSTGSAALYNSIYR